MQALNRRGRTRALLIVVILFAASLVLSMGQSHAQSAAPDIGDSITMYAGQALVQRAPRPLKRVAVGDGNLLQVKAIGTRELVLIANKAGDTSVQLWMKDGTQRSVSVHVVVGNGEEAAAMVEKLLGGSDTISVSSVGGNVVLTGRDLAPQDVARIAAIKKIYPQVLDFTSANAVTMKPTVMMRVRIMEFDKKAINQLGIKWDSMIDGPAGGLVHNWVTNPYYGVVNKGSIFEGANVLPGTQSFLGLATSITSKINLMMQDGNAWELATPQLSARSGGVADFLVGGEVPIPVSQGLGETTVEYKQYGIKLHIAPIVNSRGDISTDIETEISKIDPSVTVKGYPGFLTRRATTQMNVHEGDTIVISGLVDANASKTFDRVPGFGDIPILGSLFRSRAFQKNRTDLVIFVTPTVIDAKSKQNLELIEKSDRLRDDFQKVVGKDIVD
jgi:pilus assembly protein CpaC